MNTTQDMSAAMETPRKSASIGKMFAILVALMVIVGGGAAAFAQKDKLLSGVSTAAQGGDGSYKAVFLTNGQVYFGQIAQEDNNYLVLHKVFYLQVKQPLQGDNTDKEKSAEPLKPELNLVKLGTELHAPTDEMKVSRTQVLFTETLKDDSQVIKGIGDYFAKNK